MQEQLDLEPASREKMAAELKRLEGAMASGGTFLGYGPHSSLHLMVHAIRHRHEHQREAFRQQVGRTPGDEIRRVRVEAARKRLVDSNEKIEVMWDSVVDEVLGEDGVEGVKLRNVKNDAITEVPATGLFVAIGHNPNTGVFGDALTTDDQGFLVTTHTRTNIPGVFAAGDVQDPLYKQAVTAAGTGCMAALEVERYLAAVEG